MRINFRQGIVSYQTSNGNQNFLRFNGAAGTVDLLASDRNTVVTVAHHNTNYIHAEDTSILSAWSGPFSSVGKYWLYWDFDPLTFNRTFGFTTLEPIAQDVPPGHGDVPIVNAIPGSPSLGYIEVEGHFVLEPSRPVAIINSTSNDGTYTVDHSTYDSITGTTRIYIVEQIDAPGSQLGSATLDIDSDNNPLFIDGRHWYDTASHRHYVLVNGTWQEVIRVFAAQLVNNAFIPMSINTGDFSGTQIGDTTQSSAGRVLRTESATPLRRDDGTFFTTEDQFFADGAPVNAIRLESNVTRAQFVGPGSSIDAFTIVAWENDLTQSTGDKIRIANYDDAGQTIVGVLMESLSLNEVGSVVIQGTITNPLWSWTTGPNAIPVGSPLWVDNGQLVPYDPHVQGNRATPSIIGTNIGSTGQYFEVSAILPNLQRGQSFTIQGNSTNNDGVYTILNFVVNANSTTIYVNEPIIDNVVGGEALLTIANYPTGRVPVARILSNDTIIFEQGLGGRGDTGPPGSIEELPTAATTKLGGVFLSVDPTDPNTPIAVEDNDPRLSDARQPLSHTHAATEVGVSPGHTISSLNVQGALEELGDDKVAKSGDTMTGFLTLHANPTSALHATPKQYVDSLVSGLVWLDPVCVVNLISDTETTPPSSPNLGDSYIIPPNAIGVWATIPAGNIVTWDGQTWVDRGPLTSLNPSGTVRAGIAMQTTTLPTGLFVNRKNQIAVFDQTGTIQQFVVPVAGNAVYACSESEIYKFNQFAFSGTEWVLFGGGQALTADETTVTITGNVLSVKQYTDGGTVDATFWQGLTPPDLNTLYSPVTHNHPALNINFAPYTSTIPGVGNILSNDVQSALEESFDKKAPLQPSYVNIASLPDATTYEGMVAHVIADQQHYVAQSGTWKRISTYPQQYDLLMFIAGTMLSGDTIQSSFVATRDIFLPSGLPTSVAIAKTPPAADVTYDLRTDDGTTETIVGSIFFAAGSRAGTLNFPSDITLTAGTTLEVVSPTTVENTISDISITIIAEIN